MALLQDDHYNSSIKGHFEAGMQQLVFLAGLLLVPQPNEEEACAKTRDCVSKAFHHLSEAEEKLEGRLLLVDSQSEALIAAKKLKQDELQEKKGNVADLTAQIVALQEAEKKSQGMLETAAKHLENTKEQLRLAHEEVAKNRVGREIGLRLMIVPGLGTLIGAGMTFGYQAALDSAEDTIAKAQEAVDLSTAEVAGYGNDILCFTQKAQEMQASIDSLVESIHQIQAQSEKLLTLQSEVTVLQAQIRKCLSLLDLLEGKIHAAAVMSSHACAPKSLGNILEEIAEVLGGKDAAAVLADKGIQVSVREINKAVQFLRAKARQRTRLEN